MSLWKIYPVADRRDARWQGRPVSDEIVVRARSAAMARVIASRAQEDRDFRLGNESLSFRSGFEDEKLYWVVRLDAEQAAALGGEDGPEEIIGAWREKQMNEIIGTPEPAPPAVPENEHADRDDGWDSIDEASLDSFPASDPPAWIWRRST